MENKYDDYKEMIEKFNTIKKCLKVSPKTFMEVSGYPHFENVASNILAFLFTTDEEHGFGDLFFKTLVKLTKGDIAGNTYNISATREYPTKKGNRLDIVLQNDSYTVGIENKIFSGVHNDLQDYKETIKQLGSNNKTTLLNIILCINDEKDIAVNNGFYHINYKKFFTAIEENIGPYIQSADNTWLLYTKEFIKTINRLNQGGVRMNKEFVHFIGENKNNIENLVREYNGLKREMTRLTRSLKGQIIPDTYKSNMNIQEYCYNPTDELSSSYVIDIFMPSDQVLVVETYIDAKGWHIAIWNRSGRRDGKIQLMNILDGMNIPYHERTEDPDASMFLVIEDHDHDTPLADLTNRIILALDLVKNIQI